MKSIDNPIKVLTMLKQELSACFKKGNNKFPLAVGIDKEVIAHYENDSRFDIPTLKKAIEFYCNSTKYLSNVVMNVPRVDINGKLVSKVTEKEQAHAEKILKTRKVKILR